jgi:hypothetical protein
MHAAERYSCTTSRHEQKEREDNSLKPYCLPASEALSRKNWDLKFMSTAVTFTHQRKTGVTVLNFNISLDWREAALQGCKERKEDET